MPLASTLARMQQAVAVAVLATITVWVAWQWPGSPPAAVGGALVLAFGFSFVLALEFVLLRLFGIWEGVPRPTWLQLARAWWGETCMAVRVFYWRQPFRWRAEPDCLDAQPGRGGVVFIHGFICNRGFWNPWMRQVRAAGYPFVAVNLEPVFGSIDDYAPVIEAAVRRVTQAAGGLAPVLVCHSMGGVAARAWLRANGGATPVHHVVTIASPHRGTWLARFSHTRNGRQMRLDAGWVSALAQHRTAVPFTCWYSNCDNIVFPVLTATLAGADNRMVPGAAHVELAFERDVIAHTLQLVARAS
jgi:triacylglycerol lipase